VTRRPPSPGLEYRRPGYPRPPGPSGPESGQSDWAVVGGWLFTGLEELTSDLAALDSTGIWVVVIPFDSPPTCARFAVVEAAPAPAALFWAPAPQRGGPTASPPIRLTWSSSLSRLQYIGAAQELRQAIAAGDYYQVNLCRRLSAALPPHFALTTLAKYVTAINPAPHAAVVELPAAGLHVVCASPERFLARDGDVVMSEPIKGTASTASQLGPKDTAENVMIVDLMRNDLGRVCQYGSVTVPSLCRVESHPGLVHLVSTVAGRLRSGAGWADLLAATFPPGSVTGAPKVAALKSIARLESVPRGLYCGAIGWVDADRRCGDLNVAIRTFWTDGGRLHLGTGAGITWGSDPEAEWLETELKVARLMEAADQGVSECHEDRSDFRRPASARGPGLDQWFPENRG